MIISGTGLLQLDYDAIPSATAAGIEKSPQPYPAPGASPIYCLGLRHLALALGFGRTGGVFKYNIQPGKAKSQTCQK